jgi:outer membrane protein OmpA-like peptidoglycan-associated protein
MTLDKKIAMNAFKDQNNNQHNIQIRSYSHNHLFFVMMIFLGLMVSFNPSLVISQNKEFTRSYFPGDSKGLREARKNLQQGDRLFRAGTGNYGDAIEYYLKAHAFNPDNAHLNMRIGECYLETKDKDKSIGFLERAVALNVPTLEIYFLLGQAYQLNYRFDEAIDQFTFYRQSLTPQEAIQQRERIDRRIAQCRNGKELMANPLRAFIDNLGSNVNSEYDDYSPVLSPDGQTIYLTSRRPLGKNPRKDKVDQKYFENVFVSRRVGENWRPAEPLEGKVNTKTHEATAGISADGNRLFVYRGDKGGDLFESLFENNRWSKPKRLPKSITTRGTRETSIVFTSDGRRVYFISDRDGGFGGKDIWTSQRDERGRWGQPVNLGATVNTEFDEESLYIAPDNQSLYFSSQGHNSMGGFDIFKTVYRNGRWTQPQNLGYPVNTPGDDLFLVMTPDQKTGYYSAVKPDGYGGSDIYAITFLGPEKPFIALTQDDLIASNARPLRHNLMEGEVEVITVPMTIIRGRVMDDKTDEPLFATIELYDNEGEELLAEFSTNSETGEYFISLPGGRNYGISVKAEDYLFHSENMNVTETTVTREIINDIRLKKVEVGETIVLNNIFFDTGAATLRPESYAELGVLYKLMIDNPSLKIEISGHTDNVGSAAFNQRLSENRARAVVDFLIGRGIDVDRLTYKGYGFDKPVASNETAEGRQLNRRTEFEIIEK